MTSTTKPPAGWTVLGSGPLAEGVRAKIAADPDAYRPTSWSMKPVGHCPCCDKDVFHATTRHTGWVEGFSTHDHVVHPSVNAEGYPDPAGTLPGCCCKPGAWGPLHDDGGAA